MLLLLRRELHPFADFALRGRTKMVEIRISVEWKLGFACC